RSPQSGGLRPPCSGPARPEHRPAAVSRRSLQACIASLPLQSSLMSKTYLKSDHFNGGGSPVGHTFLEASGALTDWTPRAGAGCPRSLAHLAARCWLRGTKKDAPAARGVPGHPCSAPCRAALGAPYRCTLKYSRVSCLLITPSSSSASASLSRSITPISERIC